MAQTRDPTEFLNHSLPVQLTPFIGREAEIAQVTEMLVNTEVRLLVLTGPGGTGKSRLALQVATNVVGEFTGGVFFISLESITDADLVDETIARELGIQQRSETPVGELLRDYLREKQILLVLDGFEQVIAAAPIVADLLAACATVKCLATSREILHLQGEYDFPVPLLSLPDREAVADPDLDPVPLMTQSESVRLFADRAVAALPQFALNRENALAVADICHRLDGLPLAIELAAARTPLLPPRKMMERLDKSLSILTRGAKDRPSRQQTLRGTIDWSYELLDEQERRIFSRLSVFAGGFTLEAAEEVCRVGDDSGVDVLDVIASIAEKSLLRREDSEDDTRFAMLQTVRDYAEEKLAESDEYNEVRRKHAEYFNALAARAIPELQGLNRAFWVKRLIREYQNYRSAMVWCFDGGDEELGIEITGGVGAHFFREIRNWFDTALEKGQTPTPFLAKAIGNVGHAACNLGDVEGGLAFLARGVAMWRELDDATGLADSLQDIASHTFWNGDGEKAAGYLEECLAVSKESGNDLRSGNALDMLGQIAAEQGDLIRGKQLCEEGLQIIEKSPDFTHWPSLVRMHLGSIAMMEGDSARAAALTEESLTVFRQIDNRFFIGMALEQLGTICVKQADFESAKAALTEAMPLLSQAATIWDLVDGYTWTTKCLILFAEMARREDQIERAARLLGASVIMYEPRNDWNEPYRDRFDEISAATRAQLGDDRFETLFAEGQAMSLEEGIDYASEDAGIPTPPDKDPFPDGLSNREVDVAKLLVEGLTNREIGERLFISARTVANHVQSVLNKTGSGNRAEAAAYAVRHGLTN